MVVAGIVQRCVVLRTSVPLLLTYVHGRCTRDGTHRETVYHYVLHEVHSASITVTANSSNQPEPRHIEYPTSYTMHLWIGIGSGQRQLIARHLYCGACLSSDVY